MVGTRVVGPVCGAVGGGVVERSECGGCGGQRGGTGVVENEQRKTAYHFNYHIGKEINVPVAFVLGMKQHNRTMSTL